MRVSRAVVHPVDGPAQVVLAFPGHDAAGVGVPVEAREVAAGDLQSDAVAGLERVRGGDVERGNNDPLVGLAWRGGPPVGVVGEMFEPFVVSTA